MKNLLCLVLVLTSALLWHLESRMSFAEDDAPTPVVSFPQPSAAEAKILVALNAKTSPQWTDKSLQDAFVDLEKKHEIDIWIDVQALSDDGLSVDTQVTLNLNKIPLKSCLKLILEPLALVYLVEDDVLKITTPARLESSHITRIYPVADLIVDKEDAEELVETIRCGLGIDPETEDLGITASGQLKTLTVRRNWVQQQQIEVMLRGIRDAGWYELERRGQIKDSGVLRKQ